MTGISSGASAGAVAAVASHRGVDLGPRRGHSGFLRPVVPRTQRPAAWSTHAFDEATARDAVRYGSGARSLSRERNRDSRRVRSNQPVFDASNTMVDAGGPLTRQHWLDALNSFVNRFETVERVQREHAALISKTDEQLIEKHGRINDLFNKLNEVNAKVDQTTANLGEACRNITAKYAITDATELAIANVLGQLDVLTAQVRSLAQDPPKPDAHSEVGRGGYAFHPIHTPDHRQEHPPQHRQDLDTIPKDLEVFRCGKRNCLSQQLPQDNCPSRHFPTR